VSPAALAIVGMAPKWGHSDLGGCARGAGVWQQNPEVRLTVRGGWFWVTFASMLAPLPSALW